VKLTTQLHQQPTLRERGATPPCTHGVVLSLEQQQIPSLIVWAPPVTGCFECRAHTETETQNKEPNMEYQMCPVTRKETADFKMTGSSLSSWNCEGPLRPSFGIGFSWHRICLPHPPRQRDCVRQEELMSFEYSKYPTVRISSYVIW